MEKRVELEKRGRNPATITDLNLDNCRSTCIVGLSEEFCNLESLSLINVGLTSLKGFPKLPNLQRLELSDNRISGGINLLHGSPKLTHLNLSGNKYKDLESLEPLKEFKYLKNLDFFNCDVTTLVNYRERVFSLCPNLKYLDGFDRNQKEAEDSDVDDEEINEDDVNDSDIEDEEDVIVEDEEEDDLEDEEAEDEEVGLKYLDKDEIDEESEGDDFNPDVGDGDEEDNDDNDDDEEEEDDDEEEEEEQEASPRGQKRKLTDDGDTGDD